MLYETVLLRLHTNRTIYIILVNLSGSGSLRVLEINNFPCDFIAGNTKCTHDVTPRPLNTCPQHVQHLRLFTVSSTTFYSIYW